MSERGLYKKGEIKSRENRGLKDTKPIKEKRGKADHKHIYTKIILVHQDKMSYSPKDRLRANICEACLLCKEKHRIKNLYFFESVFIKEEDAYRVLPNSPKDVIERHPELPIYSGDLDTWNWVKNLTEVKK